MNENSASTVEKGKAISKIGNEIRKRNLCLFAGAGISMSSGMYNWTGLMKGPAQSLGLDVEKERGDLPALAQYYFDQNSPTNKKIIRDELKDSLNRAEPSKVHELICDLFVENIWTTNYDTLIEDSYKKYASHKALNVISTDTDVQNSSKKWKVNVYKMHGCINNSNSDIILSTSDYDSYHIAHKSFFHELRSQLMSKTFLFIGFSFNDPNISYILRSLKNIMYEEVRPHYLFLLDLKKKSNESKDDFSYRRRKEQYRIDGLKKYGIRTTVLEDDFDLYSALFECNLLSVKDRVVLCGSDDTGVHSQLSERLGYELVKKNYQLYTCFADGVGKNAVIGAMKYFGDTDEQYPYKKLRIWPTNKAGKFSPSEKEMYRRVMVKEAGCCIIVGGKDGAYSEFKSAASVGRLCIPIGYTGGTAKRVLVNTLENIKTINRGYNFSSVEINRIKEILQVLDSNLDIEKTIDLVLEVVGKVGAI